MMRDTEANPRTDVARLAELEGGATLALLAGEIAHALATPVSYFRELLEHLARGGALATADVDAGREEVDRLGSLLKGLRGFTAPVSSPRVFALRPALELAVLAASGTRGSPRAFVEVPDGVLVEGDPQTLSLLVLQLLRALHALDVAHVRISVQQSDARTVVRLDYADGSKQPRYALDQAPAPDNLAWLTGAMIARLAKWAIVPGHNTLAVEISPQPASLPSRTCDDAHSSRRR